MKFITKETIEAEKEVALPLYFYYEDVLDDGGEYEQWEAIFDCNGSRTIAILMITKRTSICDLEWNIDYSLGDNRWSEHWGERNACSATDFQEAFANACSVLDPAKLAEGIFPE
jgi:hypothetical protein